MRSSKRDLGLLVAGNGVSAFGNSVYLIAVMLLLKEMTESAFYLGFFQFAALAPAFLLSPILGVVIDRLSKRTLLVVSDVARGVLMIAAGVGLSVPGLQTPLFVLLIGFFVGLGHAVFVPTVLAFLPAIVDADHLPAATGMRAAGAQMSGLVGNAVAGGLFVLIGGPALFLINGVTFLLSGLSERLISVRGTASGGGRLFSEVRRGLVEVTRSNQARLLIASQALLFVLTPSVLLALPFVVIDELALSESSIGFFYASALAGGIVGFFAYRILRGLLGRRLVGSAYVAVALCFVAMALFQNAVTVALVAFVIGAAAATVYLAVTTWIQLEKPPELHGRFFAIVEAAGSVAAPTSYLVTGVVMEALGSSGRWLLFLVCGAAAAVWGLVTLIRIR